MKTPRVKHIIQEYERGNIVKVYQYLNQSDMDVDPSTWAGRLKIMIEDKQYNTAKQLIETVAYKFIKNENNGKN